MIRVLGHNQSAKENEQCANHYSYVERFNRTYRDEILDLSLLRSLTEVRNLTRSWMKKYNEERPHDALGDLPQAAYLVVKSGAEISNYVSS